jgi:hypothetical protein
MCPVRSVTYVSGRSLLFHNSTNTPFRAVLRPILYWGSIGGLEFTACLDQLPLFAQIARAGSF